MTASELSGVLRNNVVDLTFTRRRPSSRSPFRRMLCTMSESVLNSVNGRTVLNYLPPRGFQKKYNPAKQNLATAWDILMQGFRTISAESVKINKIYETDAEFWTYFNESVIPMSGDDKLSYMNP